jgi:preprotein translocase subunit SecF
MLKETLSYLRHIPSYVFLVLLILSSIVTVTALRHNNQTMIKLRDQVYVVDKNNGDVNAALNELRSYVHGHMNTNLSSGGNSIKPPIQLKHTYERLQAQAEANRKEGEAPVTIPSALYKFDFVSPTWSPDLAGWSLVLSVLLLVAFIVSFTVDRLVKARIRPL